MRSLLCLVLIPAVSLSAEPPDFDRTVAPIFASRCLDCHTGAEGKGKLDLSSRNGVTRGGTSGPAVAAGQAAGSPIWQRVDADEMPPKHPLPAAEKAILKAWIDAGAKWGSDPIDPYRFSTSTRAGTDWWSLQTLKRPTPPSNDGHAIDAFVRAKLQTLKLAPSPSADRVTLIRRLNFDLIGLPPSPAEIDQFVSDKSPDAYAKLVDRLLASPHYGERWARHWLDVAHFGESDGFEFDKMRPNAWRYRDWLIRALNADMPYDRFAKWQIAGDVLEPRNPDAITATGFLVAGAHDSLQPAGDALRQIMRQDELEDVVGVVGQSFLGMTVNCARCHDHKFDPVRQSDYYRIAAALAGVKRGDRSLPTVIPPELLAKIEMLRKQLAAIEGPAREKILRSRKDKSSVSPKPIAAWDFSKDLRDTVGRLHGEAFGTAKVVAGALKLDGQSYVVAGPIGVDLREKTLEAWVKLDTLEQGGGGVIGIQTPDGNTFDSIVYGEREPGRWMAGSEFFARTRPLNGPAETDANNRFVHIAITYGRDGQMTVYRDGVAYGQAYTTDKPAAFPKTRNAQVIFGVRHTPPGQNRNLMGAIKRANLYDRALTAEEVANSARSTDFVSDADLVKALSPEQLRERTQIAKALSDADATLSELKTRKAFAVTPTPPPPTHRLKRGNPAEKAEPISAGGLSAVKGHEFSSASDASDADRRKALADWIASERNPLFARTMVNRVWQYHFGRGLVDSPNDLGFSGGPPSHPELLDWLAAEFMANSWSLKQLHRVIVMSETYRQASASRAEAVAVDADNRLLWRYSSRRLDAESLRDATLVIAGEFNATVGGKGYQDVRPFIFKTSQFYEPLDPVGAEFNRRSIYRMTARGGRNPLLDTFDCPDPSMTTPKRGSTTTPLQAMSLMNNSFVLRMADRMAERLTKDKATTDERITHAFRLVYGRVPTDVETAASRDMISKHGLPPFCRAMLNTNGFLYVH